MPRAIYSKSSYAKKVPAPQLSTYPFSDGYPWDEELIKAGRRAISTHGPSFTEPRHSADALAPAHVEPLSTGRTP